MIMMCFCMVSAIATAKSADTTRVETSSTIGSIRKTVRGFSAIDTAYIEPQHYNYALMVQTTYNLDMYWLRSGNGQEVMLSPDVVMRDLISDGDGCFLDIPSN